jgi:hypothetical protein
MEQFFLEEDLSVSSSYILYSYPTELKGIEEGCTKFVMRFCFVDNVSAPQIRSILEKYIPLGWKIEEDEYIEIYKISKNETEIFHTEESCMNEMLQIFNEIPEW